MKRSLFILFLFPSMVFTICGQQILNPGFEMTGPGTQQKISNWEYVQVNKTESVPKNLPVKKDSIVFHSGKYSLGISSHEPGSWVFRQQKIIHPERTGKYMLSAWIKTDSVNGNVRLYIRANNMDGKSIFTDMRFQNLKGTHDWQKYSVSFYLDETIREIFFGGLLAGTGNVWMDDFALSPCEESSSNSIEAITYVKDLFRIIKENSIRKDSVNLSALEDRCINNLNGAITTSDCYPMINYLLYKLGDNHSRFLPPTEAKNYRNNSTLIQSSGKMIREKVAYLSIPPVSSMDSASLVDFASNLQVLIKKLDASDPNGWIVDLRSNTGGNCYPMIAGLGPLIGEGIAMYWVDANKNQTAISYKNGCSFMNDRIQVRIKDQPYTLRKTYPIAILIGPLTASSGEIVAISFIGKSDCRFFGESSYGMTTANSDFILRDGSTLFLTSGIDADRNLRLYGDKLHPDFYIPFSGKIYDKDSDPVINSAIDWLTREP